MASVRARIALFALAGALGCSGAAEGGSQASASGAEGSGRAATGGPVAAASLRALGPPAPARPCEGAARFDEAGGLLEGGEQLPIRIALPGPAGRAESAARPCVFVSTAGAMLVVGLASAPGGSALGLEDLTQLARRVVAPRLEAVEGVGEVRVVAGRERTTLVWLDEARLGAYGLRREAVVAALRNEHGEVPGGGTAEPRQIEVRVRGQLDSREALGDVVVMQRDGVPVRLADVAHVERTFEELRSEPALGAAVAVAVHVRADADPLAVHTRLLARAAELAAGGQDAHIAPGVRVAVVRDALAAAAHE